MTAILSWNRLQAETVEIAAVTSVKSRLKTDNNIPSVTSICYSRWEVCRLSSRSRSRSRIQTRLTQTTHSLTHSFTHARTYSFTHSCMHVGLVIYLFIYLFIYLYRHSFIHSLTHSNLCHPVTDIFGPHCPTG